MYIDYILCDVEPCIAEYALNDVSGRELFLKYRIRTDEITG
jgi:hypothetical protein